MNVCEKDQVEFCILQVDLNWTGLFNMSNKKRLIYARHIFILYEIILNSILALSRYCLKHFIYLKYPFKKKNISSIYILTL